MMATNGRKGETGAVLNQKGDLNSRMKAEAVSPRAGNTDELTNLANWALRYKPLVGSINNHSEPPSIHGASPGAPNRKSSDEDTVHEKPPCSYACLITWAIRDSEGHRIKLEGIYAWIMDRYPYFKDEGARNMRHAGWKNSVRHNLSINPCFAKGPNRSGDAKGKGGYWTIAKGFEDQATSHTLKKTSSKRTGKKGRGRGSKAATKAGEASAGTAGTSSATSSPKPSKAPPPIKEEQSPSPGEKPGQPDWAGNAAAAALAALSPRSSRPSSRVGAGGPPPWKAGGTGTGGAGVGPPPAVPLQGGQRGAGARPARSLSTSSTASSESSSSVPCSMCFTRCHFVDTSGGHCKSAQASGRGSRGPTPATAPTLGGGWGGSPVRLAPTLGSDSSMDAGSRPLYVQAVRVADSRHGGAGASADASATASGKNTGGGRKRQRETNSNAAAKPSNSAPVAAAVMAPKKVKLEEVDSATATYVMAKQAAAIERLKALARRAGLDHSEIELAAKVL